jgi:hypothetical protein
MALSEINFNQDILPQPDMESTYVTGTVASGNNVTKGMPLILSGDPAKWSIAADDAQTYNMGVALEDIDASAGDVDGRIMTGGGISISSLTLSSLTISGTSVTAGASGLLKNNNIRVITTSDAMKKVVE